MTQDEQNTDLANLRNALNAYDDSYALSADRCRYESVSVSNLWIFAGNGKDRGQIGSITRDGDAWRVQRIICGCACTNFRTASLTDALAHVMCGMRVLAA